MWVTWRQTCGSEVSDRSFFWGSCPKPFVGLISCSLVSRGQSSQAWMGTPWLGSPGALHQFAKARPVCPQSKSLNNQFGECLKRFCQVFAFASLSLVGCSPPAHPSPAGLYASDGDGRRGKMRLKSSLLPFGDFVIWLLESWPLRELVT